ncbi:MAG: hypothetical protein AB7N61_14820 [Acidimicrobiia bacterium]
MRVRSLVFSAMLLPAALFVTYGGVARAEAKTCELDPDTGLLRCTIVAQPRPPRVVDIPGVPLQWARYPWVDPDAISRGHCTRSVEGIFEIGVIYVVTLENTQTGEQLYIDGICTFPDEDPPQPPPPPPTPAELVDDVGRALTLTPSLNPSSSVGGLTGLESWLWCTDPGTVPVGVSLRGWTAAAEVEVVQLEWSIAGPSGTTRTSTSCGSETDPSVRWTPETMGEHLISLTADWAGVWELTWNGVPMGSFPLGPVPLTSPATPYVVDEYRGELTE